MYSTYITITGNYFNLVCYSKAKREQKLLKKSAKVRTHVLVLAPVYNGPSTDVRLSIYALWCTILVHFFSPCFTLATFFMLQFFHVTLFSCCTFLVLYSFCVALLSSCIISMLHFFHVAFSHIVIFPCCILYMLHFFHTVLIPLTV